MNMFAVADTYYAHGDGLVRVTQAPSPITITSKLATASKPGRC